MTPPSPFGLVPRKLPFHPAIGIHSSMRMSEEGDGSSVAVTRQKEGSVLNSGMPLPPLYPRPSPAVLAVTLPGTSGTGPIVPASAEEPPPSRGALPGTANAPALTTCASVIAVFGRDSAASLSQAAGVCGAPCASAAPGTSTASRIGIQRMGRVQRETTPDSQCPTRKRGLGVGSWESEVRS